MCVCVCPRVPTCAHIRVSACAREGPPRRSEPSPPLPPHPGPTLPALGLPKCLGACLAPHQAAHPACMGCSRRRRGRAEPGAAPGRRKPRSEPSAPFVPVLGLRRGAELPSQASAPPYCRS